MYIFLIALYLILAIKQHALVLLLFIAFNGNTTKKTLHYDYLRTRTGWKVNVIDSAQVSVKREDEDNPVSLAQFGL